MRKNGWDHVSASPDGYLNLTSNCMFSGERPWVLSRVLSFGFDYVIKSRPSEVNRIFKAQFNVLSRQASKPPSMHVPFSVLVLFFDFCVSLSVRARSAERATGLMDGSGGRPQQGKWGELLFIGLNPVQ